MELIITYDYDAMSFEAAHVVADLIRNQPDCVLGLPSGSTPLGMYRELIRMHRVEGLDFSKVTTFNLDEYYGLPVTHERSYHFFMRENFFDHVNIPARRIFIPNGMASDPESHCRWFEEKIREMGGIDLQVLGIGRDGHIGFNEPGSSLASRTRMKTLTEETIQDNARFFESEEEVPRYVLTMGVGTILEARRCLLLGSSEKKAEVVAQAVEGPVSSQITASALHLHPRVMVILDEPAASRLQRKAYYQWVVEHKPRRP